MTKTTFYLVSAALVFSSFGCSANRALEVTGTPTLYIITAALPPTLTPRPTETSRPPIPTPTIAPVEGITTTQLNVRVQPSTSAETMGMIGIFVKVQIIGKSEGGSWYQILYTSTADQSQGQGDFGWVTSAYVQVNDPSAIPVIQTPTDVLLTSSTPPEISAPAETEVVLPLSILSPTSALASFTPATEDGDTALSPAVNVSFSPSGSQSLNYISDISTPQGDPEDWVQFMPYGAAGQPASISVLLDCTGNSSISIEIWQNARTLQTWENITCSKRSQLLLNLYAGAPYLVRLLPGQDVDGLNFVHYTIIVQTIS